MRKIFSRLVWFLLSLIILTMISCSSDYPSDIHKTSGLGEIGQLKVKKGLASSRSYGLEVEADGVLGATRYYLYASKSSDPDTAAIIKDSPSNDLYVSLRRYETSGTYYFWYRAGNGSDITDYSNMESVTF